MLHIFTFRGKLIIEEELLIMKLKHEKKIPVKNYIILICLFLGTILILYFIANKYIAVSEYNKQTPIIRDTLPEIGYTEIDHYITENPSIVMYLCTASDEVCRNYEKKLKPLLVEEGLTNDITYVNLSGVDLYKFVDEFNNNKI